MRVEARKVGQVCDSSLEEVQVDHEIADLMLDKAGSLFNFISPLVLFGIRGIIRREQNIVFLVYHPEPINLLDELHEV